MISYYNGIYETAAELPARPNAGWTVTSDGNGEFSATNTYLDDATRSYINAGLLSGFSRTRTTRQQRRRELTLSQRSAYQTLWQPAVSRSIRTR